MDPMDAIKVTFFQECDEQLGELEAGLMALEEGTGDRETVNAVFRAVHSVKGGAGAFGFEDLVKFSHTFETVLDLMRSDKLAIEPDVLHVMLRASDVLADLVHAARDGGSVDQDRCAALMEELEHLAHGGSAPPAAAPVAAAAPAPVSPGADPEPDEWGFVPLRISIDEVPLLDEPAAPASDEEIWKITFTPRPALYAKGSDATILLRELAMLGECDVAVDDSLVPSLDAMDVNASYLSWTCFLNSDKDEAAIREIFEFVEGDCDLIVERIAVSTPAPIAAPMPVIEPVAPPPVAVVAPAPAPAPAAAAPPRAAPASKAAPAAAGGDGEAKAAANATIRVDLERVDRLIDLVGELVINQAMLAQRVAETGVARSSNVAMGLDELEQLTRELQDSVMAIRAQPVKSVFQRMPRLVREIATATNKQVRLVMDGEGTEVDKTVIERLSDPITHMLRNAVDHGLESTQERIDAGKPAEGTIRLAALHRSGRIVIEVSDDGRGINRERVRAKAIEKGLIAPDLNMTDEEIDNIIFLPGFSTASAISDISGRGVGMDVVKRSIQALGGRISITSNPGKGSTFTLSLPLTLAVLDGMVVSAAAQTLIAPLTTIIETLQPKPGEVRRLGPNRMVIAVRDAFVPLVDVGVALGFRKDSAQPDSGVVLLVESEGGGRAALLVDDIQGQRQVVIKSLEANYQRVEGVAAATILGDGRVALILDVDGLIAQRVSETRAETQLAKAG
ncbi:chemotaxis protein CheA [Vitreimonas flagellata]|uniref:chemotaxis protein CheA n=1 Tax=Vitreimonas flagellata TaxID=2560861 RepID=UPI001074D725|nr:chemotaxis protein CheA [Vitreimonas flagellata]